MIIIPSAPTFRANVKSKHSNMCKRKLFPSLDRQNKMHRKYRKNKNNNRLCDLYWQGGIIYNVYFRKTSKQTKKTIKHLRISENFLISFFEITLVRPWSWRLKPLSLWWVSAACGDITFCPRMGCSVGLALWRAARLTFHMIKLAAVGLVETRRVWVWWHRRSTANMLTCCLFAHWSQRIRVVSAALQRRRWATRIHPIIFISTGSGWISWGAWCVKVVPPRRLQHSGDSMPPEWRNTTKLSNKPAFERVLFVLRAKWSSSLALAVSWNVFLNVILVNQDQVCSIRHHYRAWIQKSHTVVLAKPFNSD